MKSISDIRREAINREGDKSVIILKQKIVLDKKISNSIEKKRKELVEISDVIKKASSSVSAEIETVMNDARVKANKIIENVKLLESNSRVLFGKNKQKEIELKELETELKEKEQNIFSEQQKIKKEKEIQGKDRENISEKEKEIDKKSLEVLSNWLLSISILIEAIKEIERTTNFESNCQIEIKQSIEKADTILSRASVLVKQLDSKNESLNEKAIKLQKQEILIKDRSSMLDRTAKRIQFNKK